MKICRIKGCNHACPCVCELAEALDRIWWRTLNANACAGLLLELNTSEITLVGATASEFDGMHGAHSRARLGGCGGECK